MRSRMEANQLLDAAEEQVQRSCYLPSTSEFDREGHASLSLPMSFARKYSSCFAEAPRFGEVRFDVLYHSPTSQKLRNHILSRKNGVELGSVIGGVQNSALRKRQYVDDPDLGVPLLGGTQLMQTRPAQLKYLSKALTRNLENEVAQSGWTLVSSGGTLGRVVFVHRNYEGYALSQDVMRIIPDKSKLAPGFVFAFLSSEYGQLQIQQRGYGSVVPRLREFQFERIAVPVPSDNGESIHRMVLDAFDRRAEATEAENDAIRMFEDALRRGRTYIEAEWGAEY